MTESTTFRILAIEPDPDRGMTLTRLVRQRIDADVVVAASTEAAIAAMSERMPDLMLTSALMSPSDDLQLTEHLKQSHDARHLPVLTVPPVVDTDEAARLSKRGPLSFFKRGSGAPWPAYDPEALGTRILEALEPLREVRRPSSLAIRTPDAWGDLPAMTDEELSDWCGLGVKRLRAHRWTPAELSWLSSVKMPWGLEVDLLNISSSGLLVESGSKLRPGISTAFQLWGPDKNLVIPARVVRSEVSLVNSRGVKYQAAAVFDRELDLLEPLSMFRSASAGTPRALGGLLARVMDAIERGAEPALIRAAFAQELLRLVTARDIRIGDMPHLENDGSHSVYFTVPTGRGFQAVLQVTFEPSYKPQDEEVRILKAAAPLAAVILQYEGTRGHGGSLMVAERAGLLNAW